jgi:hypothetical protein
VVELEAHARDESSGGLADRATRPVLWSIHGFRGR